MRLVVNIHQLPDRRVRVFLRGRERLMSQQFLNGAKIGSIGKQMRRERMPERMWVKIPIDIRQPDIFLNEPSDGTLRQPSSCVVQKHSLRMRRSLPSSSCGGFLRQQFLSQAPVIVERFLRLRAVRN